MCQILGAITGSIWVENPNIKVCILASVLINQLKALWIILPRSGKLVDLQNRMGMIAFQISKLAHLLDLSTVQAGPLKA